MENRAELDRRLDRIEFNVKSHVVCSNINRAGIVYILNRSPNNEMQAERIASMLGISHRTALYHLDILHDLNIVEVRKFRRKGNILMRSIWGLNENNGNLSRIVSRISDRYIDGGDLKEKIKKKKTPRK